MSRTIQKLNLSHVDAIVDVCSQAYSDINPADEGQFRWWVTNSISTWGHQDIYGIIENGELLSSMCLFEFGLNCRNQIVAAGGIGTVATGWLHRRQNVAHDMLLDALRHYRDKAVSIVTLYPFQSRFYRNIGFGSGAEVRRYRISPMHFPDKAVKGAVRILSGSDSDRQSAIACYDTFFHKTNGMSARLDRSMGDAFSQDTRVIGYEEDGELQGYMVLQFERQHAFKNDLKVRELVYNSADALIALCGFLHRQSNQFGKIIVETQDEHLQFILDDPASDTFDAFSSRYVETCAVGVGLMYRVVDVKLLFEAMSHYRFAAEDFTLKLTIADDFLPENSGSSFIRFSNGLATVVDGGQWDVEVAMDISSFSSLWMGAINLKSLLRMGLATISSSDYVEQIDRLFRCDTKPMCWQHF